MAASAGVLFLSFACAQAAPASAAGTQPVSHNRPAPWTSMNITPGSGDFRFVVMADRTGGLRPGIFEAAVGKINLLRPDFVLCVGDLITGYSEDPAEVARQCNELDGIVGALQMPFFYLAGNHDISNPMMAQLWEKRRGRAYYHFLHKDVLFLCLNTQDVPRKGNGIGKEQIAYAKDVLAKHPNVRWTFVFMHQPLWYKNEAVDLSGWKPIEEALHGRAGTVFAGHCHTYEQSVRDGHDYIMLATTGAGTDLSGPFYGAFDHILWVSMTPKGPSLANLMLDGIAAKDVTTPAANAYARDLHRHVTIAVEPLMGGPTVSGALTTTLRITNGTDLVQRFEGEWEPHATLTLTPPLLRATLNPGEGRVFQLGLQADRPLPLEETPLPRIAWTQHMNPKGYGDVRRSFTSFVPLDTVYPCVRAQQAVVVDGNLADWPALPYQVNTRDRITYPENWLGPEDGAYGFATAYDDAFVYVAVKTMDDRLMIDRGDVPWGQDSIAVTLDARAEALRASAPPGADGEFTTFLLFYLSPSEKGRMIWYLKERLPKGSQAVCVTAGTSIILELAVPVSYLNERQGGRWKNFQLNLMFSDIDRSGGSNLHWRPDWKGQSYRGAGTFRKE